MLKETAPTVSIVCNTSKIQVALFRWAVKEGQAHRRSGAARILGIGKIRGADAPSIHAGVFGKEKKEEGKGLIVHAEAKSSSRRRQWQPVQLRRESNGRSSHSGRPPFGSAFH